VGEGGSPTATRPAERLNSSIGMLMSSIFVEDEVAMDDSDCLASPTTTRPAERLNSTILTSGYHVPNLLLTILETHSADRDIQVKGWVAMNMLFCVMNRSPVAAGVQQFRYADAEAAVLRMLELFATDVEMQTLGFAVLTSLADKNIVHMQQMRQAMVIACATIQEQRHADHVGKSIFQRNTYFLCYTLVKDVLEWTAGVFVNLHQAAHSPEFIFELQTLVKTSGIIAHCEAIMRTPGAIVEGRDICDAFCKLLCALGEGHTQNITLIQTPPYSHG